MTSPIPSSTLDKGLALFDEAPDDRAPDEMSMTERDLAHERREARAAWFEAHGAAALTELANFRGR